MATNTTIATNEKGTDIENRADELVGSIADQLARSFTIGTDEEGCQHHYYRPADTVVVYDDDGVQHREYLDGGLVGEWYEYVDDKRGWMVPGPHRKTGIKVDAARKLGDL